MVKPHIRNLSGFDLLEVVLDKDETLFVKSDSQLVFDNELSVTANMGGSILGGLFRGLSTGSIFMNKIENSTEQSRSVSISSVMPGTIQAIELAANESWVLASHVYLACTSNLSITSKLNLNLANLFSGNGIFFTTLTAPPDSAGVVWINSYGGTYTRDLKETANFRAHGGLFMAAPLHVFSQIVTVGGGSLGSTLLTGNGLMMNFANCGNKGTVYLQTANVQEFTYKMANNVQETQASIELGENVAGNLMDFMANRASDNMSGGGVGGGGPGPGGNTWRDRTLKYRASSRTLPKRGTRR
jgi:uncharacterized protein (AIM24 family)